MKMIYLSLIVIFLSSCTEKNEIVPMNEDPMEQPDEKEEDMKQDSTETETPKPDSSMYSYLALGDSYTIGESVAVGQRWPVQLATKLQEAGVEFESPKIIAKTGWTTNELMAAIEAENITATFKLVSLLIGVNNQYRGYDINQQKKEFKALLLKAISFAGGDASKVFVVSIPDYGVTPFAQDRNPEKIASEIDQYNAINKEIADLYQVQYFDITPISREAASDPDLIAGDGLHPSGKMYQKWVELIFPWVEERFKP